MARTICCLIATILCVFAISVDGIAQYAQPGSASGTTPSATQPADDLWPTTRPNSESIEDQLMQQLDTNPSVAPTQNRTIGSPDDQGPPTVGSVGADPRILGVAPGQEQPRLRREGEFIVNRRGRIVQAPNAHHTLFVFDADSDSAPEPPMILTACQMLQNMEDIVRERGDQIVFIVSGQVLVYHGMNHLLPTMMRLAIDHGNLKN